MPVVHVFKDERYPDYGICTDGHEPSIDITEAELLQIKVAEDAYRLAQSILARAYEK